MSYAVQNSSSIYSTYISTIDHLPCDIVRALWLVQASNISAHKATEQIHKVLKKRSAASWKTVPTEELMSLAKTYSELKSLIEKCNTQALAEIEALSAVLNAHKDELDLTVSNLIVSESKPPDHNKGDQERLRAQLKEHYAKNPLASQVEAMQEEQLSPNVIIRRVSDQQGKLKIIFKIPRDGKPSRTMNNLKTKGLLNRDNEVDGKDTIDETDVSIYPKLRLRSRSQSLEPVALSRADKRYKSQKKSMLEHKRKMRSAGATNFHDKADTSASRVEIIKEASPEPTYCFCHQPSFGDMIACDNRKCPNGEWFHYKCVGLLNRVEALKYAKQKWYCKDSCKNQSEIDESTKKLKRVKTRRKRW